MKIFIKYKHKTAYSKDQGFYNLKTMYAWNGHVFRQLCSLAELFYVMEKNKSIMVLSEDVGGYISEKDVDQYIEFILNASEIAKVFPVDILVGREVKKEEKRDFWLCSGCSAQLPECVCPPPDPPLNPTILP